MSNISNSSSGKNSHPTNTPGTQKSTNDNIAKFATVMPPTPMGQPPAQQGGTPMAPPTPASDSKMGPAPFDRGQFGIGSPPTPPPPPPLPQPQNIEMGKFLHSQQGLVHPNNNEMFNMGNMGDFQSMPSSFISPPPIAVPALGNVNNNNMMNQLPIDTSDIDTQTKMPAGGVELLKLPGNNHFLAKMMNVCRGSVQNVNDIIMTATTTTILKQFHIAVVPLAQGGPLKLNHKFDKDGNQILYVYLWDAGIDAETYTDTNIFPIKDKSRDYEYRKTTKTFELRTIPGNDLAVGLLHSSLDIPSDKNVTKAFMKHVRSEFIGRVAFTREDEANQTLHALDAFNKSAKIVNMEHDSAQLALAALAEQDQQAKQRLENILPVPVLVHVHEADSNEQPIEHLGEMKKCPDLVTLIPGFPKGKGTKVNTLLKTIGLGIGKQGWDTAGQVRDAISQKRRVLFDGNSCKNLSGRKFLLSAVNLLVDEDDEPAGVSLGGGGDHVASSGGAMPELPITMPGLPMVAGVGLGGGDSNGSFGGDLASGPMVAGVSAIAQQASSQGVAAVSAAESAAAQRAQSTARNTQRTTRAVAPPAGGRAQRAQSTARATQGGHEQRRRGGRFGHLPLRSRASGGGRQGGGQVEPQADV